MPESIERMIGELGPQAEVVVRTLPDDRHVANVRRNIGGPWAPQQYGASPLEALRKALEVATGRSVPLEDPEVDDLI